MGTIDPWYFEMEKKAKRYDMIRKIAKYAFILVLIISIIFFGYVFIFN